MSSVIGPGSAVQFVGPESSQWPTGLKLKGVYRVARTGSDPNAKCSACKSDGYIVLTERTNWKAYCACVFRPIGGEAKSVSELMLVRVCQDA